MGTFAYAYDQLVKIGKDLYPLVVGSDDWTKLPVEEQKEIMRAIHVLTRSASTFRTPFNNAVYAGHRAGKLKEIKATKDESTSEGKRGRKPLTMEEKTKRALDKLTADL